MSTHTADPLAKLKRLAEGDMNMIETLARMNEGNFEASALDPETYQLVRIAALTAMGAAPTSWLANLSLASETGIPPERILGTLIAVAPLTGSARTISAGANISRAIGLAEAIKEAEAGEWEF